MSGEGVSSTAEMVAGESASAAVTDLSQDPLVVFCDGVVMSILGKLDVRSLAVACVVCTRWLTVASTDRLWGPKINPIFNSDGTGRTGDDIEIGRTLLEAEG
ncbi:hypothetical protein OROGR_008923 [Orobanche gracilis]